jgi:hypothetical protein
MSAKHILTVVGGVAVGIIVVRWAAAYLNVAGANTKGTTPTNKVGGITTTPITAGKVAFAAPNSTLSLLVSSGVSAVKSLLPGLQSPVPSSAKLTQYGNERSAAAAAASPVRPEYAPTVYAMLKPR